MRRLIICIVILSLFLATSVLAASGEVRSGRGGVSSDKYAAILLKYARYTKVISAGWGCGNKVFIQSGNHIFYENVPHARGTAGLYVVAILGNRVLLQQHYNTFTTPGASEGLARDIEKLPNGTFVVVAAKDEPTNNFDERGQEALYRIGAETGLLNQEFRSSYLCLGIKGLSRGMAIEQVGMEELKYVGPKVGTPVKFIFPKEPEPKISTAPGVHQRLKIGETEAIYYIPKHFDPRTAEYIFCIHGAGRWHRPGAMTHISQFRDIADIENLVVIAPAFDCILNWPIGEKGLDEKGIVKDIYLCDFVSLLNKDNEHRTDLKLIEIFEFFNKKLMKREKFHLYGHSGGGQFVVRFITFHPELIGKVAASSPGTYAFPHRDKDYPWGLKIDGLEKSYGSQIKADDLKLSESEIDQKLNQMLDLSLFLIVGGDETAEDHPSLAWQGKGTLHKTCNYYEAMKQEHERLKK